MVSDQPHSETKSLEQRETVDGVAEEGTTGQVEAGDQETSAVPAAEPSASVGGGVETEGVVDASGQQDEHVQAVEADGKLVTTWGGIKREHETAAE